MKKKVEVNLVTTRVKKELKDIIPITIEIKEDVEVVLVVLMIKHEIKKLENIGIV
jgi:hypothetical protein